MTTRELLENFTREEGIALFNAKKTDKEVYDILVSKGLTDDFETFVAEAQKLFNEKFSKMSKEEILSQIEGAELTDEQLEQIAGGKNDVEEAAGQAGLITAYAAGGIAAALGIYGVVATVVSAASGAAI